MRLKALATALLALLLSARAAQAEALPGLLKLRSKIVNESNGSLIELQHHGTLLRAPSGDFDRPRYLVITNAHAVQADTEIELRGQRLKAARWIANSDADVAILEIESDAVRAVGAADDALGEFPPRQAPRILPAWQRKVERAPSVSPGHASLVPYRADLLAETSREMPTSESPDPLPAFSAKLGPTSLGLYEDRELNLWIGSGRIRPGMSGAPLITLLGEMKIAGVATSYDRTFSYSFFARSSSLIELRKRLDQGEHGEIGTSRFKYRNGFYKVYSDASQDVRFLQPEAGGERSDGGGERSDGTGGVAGDAYAAQGIASGFLWRGTPSLGLRIGGLALYGDRFSLEWARQNGLENSVQPLPPGSRLVDHLVAKLGRGPAPVAFSSFEFPLMAKPPRQEMRPVRLRVHADGTITIDLEFLRPRAARAQIVLDAQGRLVDASGVPIHPEFRPVVQVLSEPQGEPFHVDLRPLFFYPLADPNFRGNVVENLLRDRSPVFIRVQRAGVPYEYTPVFDQPLPADPLTLTPCQEPNRILP